MPQKVYIEAAIKDEKIPSIRKFRCQGRFPTACYMHLNKNSTTNGAVIYRSAEPESYSHTEVCPYDRELLEKMSIMQVPGLGVNGKKSEI